MPFAAFSSASIPHTRCAQRWLCNWKDLAPWQSRAGAWLAWPLSLSWPSEVPPDRRQQPLAGTTLRAAPDGAVTVSEGPASTLAHGAYFGARVRGDAYTESAEIAAVDRLQQSIGRRLAIVHVYHLWSDLFPSSSDVAFLRQGSTLLLSWSGTDTLAIIAGRYDHMIRQRALAMKSIGKPIFLEWRWEMDRSGLQTQIHSPRRLHQGVGSYQVHLCPGTRDERSLGMVPDSPRVRHR